MDIATRYAAKNRANRAIVIGWHLLTKNPPPMLLEEDGILPYSEVIGNVHDNKELWGGNE